MKVLIVARSKSNGFAPFITEQVAALQKIGIKCSFFGIKDKGLVGYLRHLHDLKAAIRAFQPDIIHAHYGLSGLFANFQRMVPVVTTYHGSDINLCRVRYLSRFSFTLSALNIFVSQKSIDISHPKGKYALIPCGVTLEDFPIIDKQAARAVMKLEPNKKYILFAGAFDVKVKNAPLAQAAVKLLDETELLELKGYNRAEVATLIQAVDTLLMTSYSEGSPQIIKEAMACGCPIVSVDVGDVKELVSGLDGCYITDANEKSIADSLAKSIQFCGRTQGRSRLINIGLTNEQIATRIKKEYELIVSNQ